MMKTVVVLLLIPVTVLLLLLLVFVVLFFLGFRFKPTVGVDQLIRDRDREPELPSIDPDLLGDLPGRDPPDRYDDGDEEVEWGGPGLPR